MLNANKGKTMENKLLLKKEGEEEKGATMLEYVLLAALIAIACIVAMNTLSSEVQQTFNNISSTLDKYN